MLTKEQLDTLRAFSNDTGPFRCTKLQASELAAALTEALATLDRLTPLGYTVHDFATGLLLAGTPNAELVRRSLEAVPEGAAGAYLANGQWRWLDQKSRVPLEAVDYRTVYVMEKT